MKFLTNILTFYSAIICAGLAVKANCTEGDIRLVDGTNDYQGRVEVCHNNVWGTVCDDSWSQYDGVVACRQLGLRFVSVTRSASFGQGTGWIWLDDLYCTPSDTRLVDCTHNGFGIHDCGHGEDAGVVCDASASEPVPVRLVNGDSQFEGRVEVYYNGQWGTVCDDDWDILDANVVCNQLGFGDALRYYPSGYFGSGDSSMPIWLGDVLCTTRDRYLSECSHGGWGNNNCRHYEDAGVACNGTANTTPLPVLGQVRLTNGSNHFEGHVEVYYSEQWGTICDDNWDLVDADVVCQQLGFGEAVRAYTGGYFGSGNSSIPIWLSGLQCTTGDHYLSECIHNGWGNGNCTHSEDAGVVCNGIANTAVPVPLHLRNGSNQYEGRVEVYYRGQWGTICDNNWDIEDANVVCHQLGFGDAVRVYSSGYFGNGNSSMPIWLDNLQCTTGNRYLSECSHDGWGNKNCTHAENAGVVCNETDDHEVCTEGDIRLVDGDNDYEGCVEVCHNEEWGTVCDDGWSRTDAIVACRQLGLEFVRITAPYHFEPGSGLIWLDELMCTGNETRLINCEHNGFGIHNCIHYEDAGVVCRSSTVSGLSAGAVAGITAGCALAFLTITVILIAAFIYSRHHYIKEQNRCHAATKQPPTKVLIADGISTTVASCPPSSPEYATELPNNDYAFTPPQSCDFPSQSPPEYEPPTDYTSN